jgi:hypothetical protein
MPPAISSARRESCPQRAASPTSYSPILEAARCGQLSEDGRKHPVNASAMRFKMLAVDSTHRFGGRGMFLLWVAMNASQARWCWRKDLAEFRGLTDRERAGFLLVLEWFENSRQRRELPAGREAAKAFWRSEVTREGREREKWQLEQWGDAIQWYLNGLNTCCESGADHRSLPESVRAAVHSSGIAAWSGAANEAMLRSLAV